jgi:hypothetical protein
LSIIYDLEYFVLGMLFQPSLKNALAEYENL